MTPLHSIHSNYFQSVISRLPASWHSTWLNKRFNLKNRIIYNLGISNTFSLVHIPVWRFYKNSSSGAGFSSSLYFSWHVLIRSYNDKWSNLNLKFSVCFSRVLVFVSAVLSLRNNSLKIMLLHIIFPIK